MVIHLNELNTVEKQYYLQHAVVPRPICFASTVDINGVVNLSPFSFFNMFSSDPPVLIFSPSRRVRDNTTKHTLENILEVPEVVIHIVTYDMVHQVSLSSCEYPKGTDEFIKAGFTKKEALMVRPPLVSESRLKMECKVLEVKSLGDKGGAGQLVICEVLCMHIDDSLFNENGKFDQTKLQAVARLGGNWYCRVSEENLFEVPKPNIHLGIGIDALPDHVKFSKILTGNHLGQLGNLSEFPGIDPSFDDIHVKSIVQYFSISPADMEIEMHRYAASLLDEGKVAEAWQVLLTV